MGKPGRRDLLKSLLLVGVVSQLSAAPAAANDHTVEKEFTLSTGGLDLKFDTRTGAWTELIDQKSGRHCAEVFAGLFHLHSDHRWQGITVSQPAAAAWG